MDEEDHQRPVFVLLKLVVLLIETTVYGALNRSEKQRLIEKSHCPLVSATPPHTIHCREEALYATRIIIKVVSQCLIPSTRAPSTHSSRPPRTPDTPAISAIPSSPAVLPKIRPLYPFVRVPCRIRTPTCRPKTLRWTAGACCRSLLPGRRWSREGGPLPLPAGDHRRHASWDPGRA